jgi:hypothetical protein
MQQENGQGKNEMKLVGGVPLTFFAPFPRPARCRCVASTSTSFESHEDVVIFLSHDLQLIRCTKVIIVVGFVIQICNY